MEKNYTTDSVYKSVLLFSLPYLLSYFLQTLYGMADLFIIGQFEGVASTTAVSVGSQVMHMLTVMIVGLAMGTTVSIGQAVGSGNRKQAAQSIGNTVILFMIISVLLMAVLLILVHPIVSVMSTPDEAVDGTVAYLTICFIGIPFITAYNIISSIFRGMGDSRSPMYFIAVACAANIFRCGKAGACRADPAVCYPDRRRLRPRCLYCDAVCRGAGRLAVYGQERGGRSRCHPPWRTVSPRLHLGLYFCRHTFQFQRILLRLREIGTVVSAQYYRHHAGARSRRIPDLAALPGNASSDGTGYGCRFVRIRADLRRRICRDPAQGI